MAFVNSVFPNPGLLHGLKKSWNLPTTIVGNSVIETRLQKLQHFRSAWVWPARAMTAEKRNTLFNFIVNTMDFSKNSVLFKDPAGSKWDNTTLSYDSSNLFKLTTRGSADKHPVFHIGDDVVVKVDGVAATFTKSIVNGVPYVAVTGATSSSVVTISGTFYYAVRLDQGSLSYSMDHLNMDNSDFGGLVGDVALIEVFEY